MTGNGRPAALEAYGRLLARLESGERVVDERSALVDQALGVWARPGFDTLDPSHPVEAVAAAVAAVARAAGLPRTTSAIFPAEREAVARVVRELGPELRLDAARGW